jgi:phenylpropionate dioxygenase-like ring-hydroxylating dioxygenase large terminal subunit
MEPIAQTPLPTDWYTNPDAFSQERRTLFAREWQMIGRADQIAAPGAYICANLAGWPVFVLRDTAGGLGAFRNACRHQNLPVLDNGAGTTKLLRCRFHGWTYDFTGAFLSAPPMVGPQDAASPDHHLQPYGVAEWRGLVFIAPDPAAVSPAASLDALLLDAPLPDDRAPLDHFRGEISSDLDCNWKVVVDRYLAGGDGFRWHFPCLAFEPMSGGLIVHQIVPRSHLRSRIVRHVYAAGDADAAALSEAASRYAPIVKAACEETQARYQAGTVAAELASDPALAAFRARLRAVHAGTPG